MRKDIVLPALAVGGGVLGFGLRKWQWAGGYDPDTQLFLHGHPASAALIVLSILLAAVFLLAPRKAKLSGGPDAALRCPSTLYMTLMAASAMLFLCSGVLGLLEGINQLGLWRAAPKAHLLTYPFALLLCALLSIAAGPSTLLVGKGAYRGRWTPNSSLLVLFPAVTALTWLFSTHLAHSIDPILMRYGFSLAAAALLMLAHYDTAAFYHERSHPRRAIFCALLGVSMGLISLADSPGLFQLALTAAFVLSALANVQALLRSAFGPPWPKRLLDARASRFPRDAEEEDEETPDYPD